MNPGAGGEMLACMRAGGAVRFGGSWLDTSAFARRWVDVSAGR
jgi:hypothetical protein